MYTFIDRTSISYMLQPADLGDWRILRMTNTQPNTVIVDTYGKSFYRGNSIIILCNGSGPTTVRGGGTTPVTIKKATDQSNVLSQYHAAVLLFESDTTAMLIGGMNHV